MPRLFTTSFAVLFLCYSVQDSSGKQNAPCSYSQDCQRQEVCCRGACSTSCPGKYCRWSNQCGKDKCCAHRCRKTCEGSGCFNDRDCGQPLKCCRNICRKNSCLGVACETKYKPYQTCGKYGAYPLHCCTGNCSLSCQDKPCKVNRDCGGWGTRSWKCCNGVCKRSCLGLPCNDGNDCHGLECCGYFGSKTCQRTCLNRKCGINADCRDRRMRLSCCGDETCRRNCRGSVCNSETHQFDCAGPYTLYCCGIGQKRCRYNCRGVPCKTTADCGPTYYYCGVPNSQNISTCTENWAGDPIIFPL